MSFLKYTSGQTDIQTRSSQYFVPLGTGGELKTCRTTRPLIGAYTYGSPKIYKNSPGDETANVNFYAVRPEATRIR